jgi:hypothetical protein
MTFSRVIPLFRVFSVVKAKEFYIDWLGFKIDWEHGSERNPPVYLQISRGDLVLHLTGHYGDCCPGAKCFVEMTGVEDLHWELSAKNYPYVRPGIEVTDYKARCVNVIDPFGNRISFNEYLKG